ncbi:protein phosphatase 4, regulatory subunit 2 [Mortierella sp. GBA30]|nr:protein phosphatase 4, regulatory subunit 2 [Mortierella sp. GBA30]
MTDSLPTAAGPLDGNSLIHEIAFTNQVSVNWEELRKALKERLNQVFESKQLTYTSSTVTNPRTTTLVPLSLTGIDADPAISLGSTAPVTNEQITQDISENRSEAKDQSQDRVPEHSTEISDKEQDLDTNTAQEEEAKPDQAAISTVDKVEVQAEGQTPTPELAEQQDITGSNGSDTNNTNGITPVPVGATERSEESNMVPISKDTLLVETPEGYRERISGLLDKFTSAPFTIQRVCELLSNPTEHHSSLIKYLRAVEKVLMITSSISEFSNPAYNGPSALDEDNESEDQKSSKAVNGDYSRSTDLDFSLITTSAVHSTTEPSDQDEARDNEKSGEKEDAIHDDESRVDQVQSVSGTLDGGAADVDPEKIGDQYQTTLPLSADMEVDSDGPDNAYTMEGVETAVEAKDNQEIESSDAQVDSDADSSMEM